MILDIVIDDSSLTIEIDKPFDLDLDDIVDRIGRFARSKEADIAALDVRGLIPMMIKGIVGCERGCPANAKDLVSRGYKGFDLHYIEGGILTARTSSGEGRILYLKMFPDF